MIDWQCRGGGTAFLLMGAVIGAIDVRGNVVAPATLEIVCNLHRAHADLGGAQRGAPIDVIRWHADDVIVRRSKTGYTSGGAAGDQGCCSDAGSSDAGLGRSSCAASGAVRLLA